MKKGLTKGIGDALDGYLRELDFARKRAVDDETRDWFDEERSRVEGLLSDLPEGLGPEGMPLRVFLGLEPGERLGDAYVFRVSYPHPVQARNAADEEFQEVLLEDDAALALWADGRFGADGWTVRDLA